MNAAITKVSKAIITKKITALRNVCISFKVADLSLYNQRKSGNVMDIK